MSNAATCGKIHSGAEKWRYYSWLEDYLERLEGKEAYRTFQDHHYEDPDYYVLVASLAA